MNWKLSVSAVFAAFSALLITGCTMRDTAAPSSPQQGQTQSKSATQPEDAGNLEDPQQAPVKLTAQQAKERMDENPDAIILDVRTAEEYAQGHIPGAVLLPNEDITDTPPQELPDLDAEILVYCRSGNRSAQAAEKLAGLGYSQVSDFGGIQDWPYDTTKGNV